MSYEPDAIVWHDEHRFAELVAKHRSGFCADYDLQAGADFCDTAPAPAEACTEIGHVDSIADLESDTWVYVAIALGCIGALLLSVMAPMGFAP